MERQIILPEGAPRPVSYYCHGIRVGSMLYTAGQTARNAAGELVGTGDAALQVRQVLTNLSLVLRDGGMGFSNIDRINLFIRDRNDLPIILESICDTLNDHRPAMTVAIVNGLAFREYLLEIEVIASCH